MSVQEKAFDVFQLLKTSDMLIFLVGAGVSCLAPASIPTGHDILDEIIKRIFPTEMIQVIWADCNPRFEELLSFYKENIDSSMQILDIFAISKEPNIQHEFLAENLKKGNSVFTTNFDSLIEVAAVNLVGNDGFDVIITEREFIDAVINVERIPAVIKLHGSLENVKLGKDERDSIITTLDAIGKIQLIYGFFQIETWKENLFKEMTNGKILVVLGYSGSDDFDIVPMLEKCMTVSTIIWVEHKAGVTPQRYLIPFETVSGGSNLDILLSKTRKLNPTITIYKLPCDTTLLVEEIMAKTREESETTFDLNDWLEHSSVLSLPEWKKWHLAGHYFRINGQLDNSKNCLLEAFRISDLDQQGTCLNSLGMILDEINDQEQSFECYDEARKIVESKLDDLGQREKKYGYNQFKVERRKLMIQHISIGINLGALTLSFFQTTSIPEDSVEGTVSLLKCCIRTLELFYSEKEIDAIVPLVHGLANLGYIFLLSNRIKEAIINLDKASRIASEGIKSGISQLFRDIASIDSLRSVIYTKKGDIEYANEILKKVLETIKKVHNPIEESMILFNLGKNYALIGNHKIALRYFKKALEIVLKKFHFVMIVPMCLEIARSYIQSDIIDKAIRYNILGLIFIKQMNNTFLVRAYMNFLDIHEKKKEWDLARECIDELEKLISVDSAPKFKNYLKDRLAQIELKS